MTLQSADSFEEWRITFAEHFSLKEKSQSPLSMDNTQNDADENFKKYKKEWKQRRDAISHWYIISEMCIAFLK